MARNQTLKNQRQIRTESLSFYGMWGVETFLLHLRRSVSMFLVPMRRKSNFFLFIRMGLRQNFSLLPAGTEVEPISTQNITGVKPKLWKSVSMMVKATYWLSPWGRSVNEAAKPLEEITRELGEWFYERLGNHEKGPEETSHRIPDRCRSIADSRDDCRLYRGQVHIILKQVKGGVEWKGSYH